MRPSGTAPDIPCMVVWQPAQMQARKAYHNHVTTWHVPCNRGNAADYGGPRAPPCPKQQLNAIQGSQDCRQKPSQPLCAAGENFWCNPYLRRAADWAIFSSQRPSKYRHGHRLVRESRGQKGLEQKSIADMQSIFEPRVASQPPGGSVMIEAGADTPAPCVRTKLELPHRQRVQPG